MRDTPELKAIDGGREGYPENPIEQYSILNQKKEVMRDELNMNYPFLIKPCIEAGWDTSGSRMHEDSIFMNDLHPHNFRYLHMRNSSEILFDMILLDREAPLSREEKDIFFYVFSSEIAEFYFCREIISAEADGLLDNRRMFDYFYSPVIEGLRSCYRDDPQVFLLHHDFFYDHFSSEERGAGSDFRNAWILWYNSIGDHSVQKLMLDRAEHFSTICDIALKERDVGGFSRNVANLRNIVETKPEEYRAFISQRLYHKALG
ncbi:MAG: hypothetical protein R6U32_02415 [Candidatus Woesearchaeota archaeon]